MESILIVSSVNPPKKFRCPYFKEEGGSQAGCQNVFIFYVLIMGGREGVKVNKSNVISSLSAYERSLVYLEQYFHSYMIAMIQTNSEQSVSF